MKLYVSWQNIHKFDVLNFSFYFHYSPMDFNSWVYDEFFFFAVKSPFGTNFLQPNFLLARHHVAK